MARLVALQDGLLVVYVSCSCPKTEKVDDVGCLLESKAEQVGRRAYKYAVEVEVKFEHVLRAASLSCEGSPQRVVRVRYHVSENNE